MLGNWWIDVYQLEAGGLLSYVATIQLESHITLPYHVIINTPQIYIWTKQPNKRWMQRVPETAALYLEPVSQAQGGLGQGWKGYTPLPKKLPTGGQPHDSPEPPEDPTTPKAKRVCPISRAENFQTDEDSETDETPSIHNFLFSSSTTPSSDSIQQMDKFRKLLKEALTLASALNNTPSSPVHWDQTILWLTDPNRECRLS